MPRRSRKSVGGNYFHVMTQGIGKEYVFPDDNSKGFYISCLQKNKAVYPVKIIAFCVMGNHAHVLLSVSDHAELSKYLRRVNSDYARYYNRVHKRVGYVFRDRFRSELITDVKYLCHCAVYIQNNPIKAGIAEKAEDYKYSSFNNYLCGRGVVDFDESAKFFDVTAENMRAIMAESGQGDGGIDRRNGQYLRPPDRYDWMEHDDKDYDDKYEVLTELLKRYNVSSKRSLKDDDLVRKIALEIRERSGASLRQIAEMLEIGRERLRLLLL